LKLIRLFILTILLFLTVYPTFSQIEFSQDSAYNLLKYLSVDIGPRPMGSPAEQRALRFAQDRFKEDGCDTSYIMPFDRYSRGNTNSGVAVGIKYGITKRIIVIGAHIDSAEPEVPGANDDGSGSAVVLEAARVLCKRQTQSTIVFCCFGGEESGLVGSNHFISNFAEIDSVMMMLQIDMANGGDILDIDPDAHGSFSAPRWLVKAAFDEYKKLGYGKLRYPTHFFSINHAAPKGPGSDHEPFLQKGIPSLAFVSDVGYPIHTSQDNFENFNPSGLKRSGDLVLKLIEKFDAGVPSKQLEQYWLYSIIGIPIFLPIWFLWLSTVVVSVLTIYTFILVRKRREPRNSSNRIRWSGVKLFLFTFIIISCGWFSSDLIGLIKGVRHPWLNNINLYYILATIAMMIGGWIVVRLSNFILLSKCPYIFFKRAIIILFIFLIGLGILSPKLTVEPAAALFLISLSMLIPNPLLKIILVSLSPLWMIRLIFSEWSDLFIRGIAKFDTNAIGPWGNEILNGTIILMLCIYILPFVFAIVAVLNDSQVVKTWLGFFHSKYTFFILLILYIAVGSYAATQQVFDNRWQKDIIINEEYNLSNSSRKIEIKSSEYLDGINISRPIGDTLIKSKTTSVKLEPSDDFDTGWVKIERRIRRENLGDNSFYDIELNIKSKYRPYTISIKYNINGKDLSAFGTPFQFRTSRDREKIIELYSFPDSVIKIPIIFTITGNDTVKESTELIFDRLVYPIRIEGENINLIPRTKFIENHEYY